MHIINVLNTAYYSKPPLTWSESGTQLHYSIAHSHNVQEFTTVNIYSVGGAVTLWSCPYYRGVLYTRFLLLQNNTIE